MGLDLSAGALVDAGGGIAFVLVGLLAGISKGGGRARVYLAGTCSLFGVVMVVENVFTDASLDPVVVAAVVACSVFAPALAVTLARHGSSRARLALAGVGTTMAVSLLGATISEPAAIGSGFGARGALAVNLGYGLFLFMFMVGAMALAGAAAGVQFAQSKVLGERRALASLGFGLLAFPMYFASRLIAYGLPAAFLLSTAFVVFAGAVAWRPRSEGPAGRVASLVFLGLVGLGLASLAYAAAGRTLGITLGHDIGAGGTIRTMAAFFLARAILRDGLLGIEPPRFAQRKGALAAGSLALLFIVAQVSQNFFSAQYGVLMGGIVAGAFLFAASPLQRVAERVFQRAGNEPVSATPSAPAPPSKRRDEAFRRAVRLALRDRRITREEELELHRVADELGLAPSRAHEILVVEERTRAGMEDAG